jgi:hypothetical protein
MENYALSSFNKKHFESSLMLLINIGPGNKKNIVALSEPVAIKSLVF